MEIELHGGNGLVRVVRSHDGSRSRLTLELGEQSFRDDGAESRLHEVLWPDAVFAPDANSALTTTLTRSVYLQQDVVGQFIDGDSPRERFEAVSELVGAGRVTELTLSLESAKRAWSTQTNRQDQDLESLQTRLAETRARLDSLSNLGDVDQVTTADQWGSWWQRASQLEDVVEGDVPEATSAEAPTTLELAVKRLDVRRLAVGRCVSLAEELDAEIEERAAEKGKVAHDPTELTKQAEVIEAQLGHLSEALAAAEKEASERRRRQVERREREEELRALAELAIRHLEGACPVCGQEHDAEKTKRHLEELIGADGERRATSQETGAVNALTAEVERTRRELSETRSKLSKAEAEARAREQWETEQARRLAELKISATDTGSAHTELRELVSKLRSIADEIDALQAEGERLALAVAGLGERARRGEYEDQVKRTEAELSSKEMEIEARRQSGERAGQILEALREASSSVVAAQLRRVEPLLQRIYATVDPHPSLRDISLALSISRGRGHLDTPLDDAQRPVSASLPGAILSSSQLNALAVSVFLALNLGVPTIPLGAAMLDDPLQSLDDVNLLGLIDLLRRTKDRRQLIVSTHDSRFGRLLARKLRPVSPDQRTLVITLAGWGRDGPTITQGESPRDSEVIRIAA